MLAEQFNGAALVRPLLMLLLCSGVAQAQPEVGFSRQGLSVVPRLSLTQVATDNLRMNDSAKDRALVTTLAPGLSLSLRSARARVVLDYSLNGLLYSKSEQKSQVQNSLSANASVNVVEGWLSVDTRAQVGQQAISAFGATGSSNTLVNQNQTETAQLAVSPIARGRVLDVASYELRGSLTESRAKNSVAGDVSGRSASLRVEGLGAAQRALNWYVSTQTAQSTPKQARRTTNTSSIAGLRWRPDVDWLFGMLAGAERSDLASLTQTTSATYGLDAAWTPSPRTTAQANWQHHDFGDSHVLSLEHRMSRSAFRFSDTSNSTGAGSLGATGRQTNYELLFQQFANVQPDPIKRDELVRQFLQANGIAPDAITGSGFLSNSAARNRRQEASISWTGLRLTLTGSLSQSTSRRLGPQQSGSGDLANSGLVRQLGLAAGVAYRLTPDTSWALNGSYQRTRGDLATQATSLKTIMSTWNSRLGRLTTAQLGMRHTQFTSATQPYRENALLVTLVQQF